MSECPTCHHDAAECLTLEQIGELLPGLLDALAAAHLGRRGGRKGGKARAANLTPERRSELARLAARARWDAR